MKNNISAKIALIVLVFYILLQNIVFFLLRRLFLMTVYQTVVAYGAICATGLLLLFSVEFYHRSTAKKLPFADLSSHKKQQSLCAFLLSLRNSYFIFWSGVHGVILLGFLTCGTYYLTLTEVTFVQLVNIFLGITLYWVFYLCTQKVSTSIGLGNLLLGFIGVLNRYLVRFRGAPFNLSDLKAAQTAGNVAQNYDFTPDTLMLVAVAELLLWYIVWRYYLKTSTTFNSTPTLLPYAKRSGFRNWWTGFVTAILLCGCIALPIMDFAKIYARTTLFAQDAYLSTLLADFMGNDQSLPDDYSTEQVDRIILAHKNHSAKEETDDDTSPKLDMAPNIVVIMNEAFSDLRVLGDFTTNQPFLEYWDSLQANTIRGWANVSVLGGTTANSEYEFLTSDAIGVYGNAIPYNSYFSSDDNYPSLVSVLNSQGYESTAFHPYLASGWNRTQVYRAMQFDHIIFQEDLKEPLDTLRHYTSDRGNYSFLMNWFNQKEPGVPQFYFNVTMQNHGGYTYSGDNYETTVLLTGDAAGLFPETEQYLSLIKASDEALKELLHYFESYAEPVIVVLFGDHQPRLEDAFYEHVTGLPSAAWNQEQLMAQYKTPFIIWHNYESESQDIGDVSLQYLASILLQDAGLEMSNYQEYVLELYHTLPVYTRIGAMDKEGHMYHRNDTPVQERINEYRQIVLNHTVDREGRRGEFFNRN